MPSIFASKNQLALVEPHAVALEKQAELMDEAGIGGHPKRGHAAILRDMAGCLRADAARGKLSDTYDGMYASASADDVAAGLAQIGVIDASAENSRRQEVMRSEAIGALRRLGVDVTDLMHGSNTLNAAKVNAALAGKDISLRMRAKGLAVNAGIQIE